MNGYDLQKRNFLKNIAVAGAAGGIVAMSQLSAAAEGSDCPSKNSVFNVRDFGAKGDGKTSDTAAIQSALDAAGKIQGTVYFPAGRYVCAKLKLPPNTTMLAEPQWGYRGMAGAVLQLESEDADCVVDITGSFGGRVCAIYKRLGQKGKNFPRNLPKQRQI